jgi:hypothetical protein
MDIDHERTHFALAWCGLLFIASFGLRWLMLNQSSVASGMDGYYYAEQARHLAQYGNFRSFENSIVVVLFGVIQKLIGNPVVSVKIGACLLAGLAAPAGFFFGNSGGRSVLNGMLLGSFLAVSPSFSFLCAHFPKTAGSIVFLFLALGALESGFKANTRKGAWLILCGLSLLALASSHKLVFIVGVWVAVGICLDHLPPLPSFRWRTLGLGLAGVLGLAWGMKAVLPADLARLWPALTLPQGWPLTILSERVFLHPAIKAEIIMGLLGLLPGSVLLWFKAPRRFQTIFWLLLIPILFNPFLDFHVLDLGYRLILVAFLPGIVLWSRWAGSDQRKFAAGLAICGLFSIFTARVYDPKIDEENLETYQEVVTHMPKNDFPLIICHLGLNYYYTWATGKDTLAFVPDDALYPPEETWRISWGVSRDAYDELFPLIDHDGSPDVRMLTTDYALIREDVWRQILEHIPPGTFLASLTRSWRNPYEARPSFILKRSIGRSQ